MGKKKPGRPKKPAGQLRRVISASVSADAYRHLQALERDRKLTRSQAIEFAILNTPIR